MKRANYSQVTKRHALCNVVILCLGNAGRFDAQGRRLREVPFNTVRISDRENRPGAVARNYLVDYLQDRFTIELALPDFLELMRSVQMANALDSGVSG